MTEKELAIILAENNSGITISKAEAIIRSFKRTVTTELKRGRDVKLINLMTITTIKRKAGKVVDVFDTTKMVKYPSMVAPKVRFSNKFKKILRE